MAKALEVGGLYLLSAKEDGTAYCPICEAIEHTDSNESYWIDGPADAALDYCKKHNLLQIH